MAFCQIGIAVKSIATRNTLPPGQRTPSPSFPRPFLGGGLGERERVTIGVILGSCPETPARAAAGLDPGDPLSALLPRNSLADFVNARATPFRGQPQPLSSETAGEGEEKLQACRRARSVKPHYDLTRRRVFR